MRLRRGWLVFWFASLGCHSLVALEGVPDNASQPAPAQAAKP